MLGLGFNSLSPKAKEDKVSFGVDMKASRSSTHSFCFRMKDPFQGPEMGFCLTPTNELSEETHMLTEQETIWERGAWAESKRVRQQRRSGLPLNTKSHEMGLVSGLSLINHSDSGSFLVAQALLSHGGFL